MYVQNFSDNLATFQSHFYLVTKKICRWKTLHCAKVFKGVLNHLHIAVEDMLPMLRRQCIISIVCFMIISSYKLIGLVCIWWITRHKFNNIFFFESVECISERIVRPFWSIHLYLYLYTKWLYSKNTNKHWFYLRA